MPVAIAILAGLFAIQSRGTERVGKLFGPIMIVYFLTLAALGLLHIVKMPSVVLEMLNPLNAINFFMVDGFRFGFFGVSDTNPWISLGVVGLAFLAVASIALRLLQTGYKIRH